jgi:aspartyl-tRNA(Asn)/glutamyl-tRNA(Gln) amidotransferase subunit C
MKISTEELLHVAKLARLGIDPQAADKLAGQVATILAYVDTLAQVDTEGVPPTAHAIGVTNAFREDRLHPHLPAEQALANAPAREEDFFLVPKVIG